MKKNNFKKFWKLGKKEHNTQYFDINKDGELIIYEGRTGTGCVGAPIFTWGKVWIHS
jgi:hypothetical protein